MSLPESQILGTLGTKIIYPVPSVSVFNTPSNFFDNFDEEFTSEFKKQKDDKNIFVEEFLPQSEIIEKTNNIIANKSSEIFMDSIKDGGFIVDNEADAKLLLSAIQQERGILNSTNEYMIQELQTTGNDISPGGSVFDEIFTRQIKGEDIVVDLTNEEIEELANEFDVGFGTFDDLEDYFVKQAQNTI